MLFNNQEGTKMRRLFLFCIVILSGLAVILGYSIISNERTHPDSFHSQLPQTQKHQPSLAPSSGSFRFDFGNVPLYFIPNKGQTNKNVRFYARTSSYTLWITQEGIIFDNVKWISSPSVPSLERDYSRLMWLNAQKKCSIIPLEISKHHVNYYKGKDKSKWVKDIETYRGVLIKEIYNNIDLKIYGTQNRIEYDWIVKKGGNPLDILLKYDNVKNTAIDTQGNLSIKTEFCTLKHKKPVSYQQISTDKIPVHVIFERKGPNIYGFKIGAYSKEYPLVIDPLIDLEYATYLGGSNNEQYPRIAVDNSGQVYIVGNTYSDDFPVKTPYQATRSGNPSVFLTKLNATGTDLLFSTYFGGSQGEFFNAITLSPTGDVFIAGDTISSELPAINEAPGGESDGFIARFDTDGHFIQGRFLGGWDIDKIMDIAMLNSEMIIVSGYTYSSNFPLKRWYQNTIYGAYTGFITIMYTDLSHIDYSTFFGGNGEDLIARVVVDDSGFFYAYGRTNSTDLPLEYPIQSQFGGGMYDTFVTKFSQSGLLLKYSSYIGGMGTDFTSGAALDSTGSLYILGFTDNQTGFPLKNPYQSTLKGDFDFFICKINPDGKSLGYSTFFGGSGADYHGDIDILENGFLIVTGSSNSTDFPLMNPLQAVNAGGFDTIISIFSLSNFNLLYSSYFGGTGNDYGRSIKYDSDQNFFIGGVTQSTDLPVKNSFQSTNAGSEDAFILKYSYPGLPSKSLNVTSFPSSSVPITVYPGDFYHNAYGLTPFTRYYKKNEDVVLVAPSTFGGKNFYKWSVEGTDNFDRTTHVIMDKDHTATVYYGIPNSIVLNRSSLTFGGSVSGPVTGNQSFLITKTGDFPLNWTVTHNASWLTCNPESGTGSGEVIVSVKTSGLTPGTYNGVISVSDSSAINSPQTINVTFNVYPTGISSVPFGSFDTPTQGATLCSSVPVTGWALDDIEIANVKIYRQDGAALVYIGDGNFVEGARPDVQETFPSYPNSYKAGWGYMMLTTSFPNKGNGVFTIQVIATDKEGNQTSLGTKTITLDNAHAINPFGYIDTPSQGGTASGSSYINFGWAITPPPNIIPIDGSTIQVFIDGIPIGHPTYNNYRIDIATLYPEYLNSLGAVGYYYINTKQYPNGVHSIYWVATDNAGNTGGIGSRFFSILNSSSTAASKTLSNEENLPPSCSIPNQKLSHIPSQNSPIKVKTGFNNKKQSLTIYPQNDNTLQIQLKELDRVVIDLRNKINQGTTKDSFTGYLIVCDRLYGLPVGSTFDSKGLFYWQPGPGFIGTYKFVFIQKNSVKGDKKQFVNIKIEPMN